MNTIGVIANHDKPEVARVLAKLVTWARDRGKKLITDEPLSAEASQARFTPAHSESLRARFDGCDLVLALGGDGTLLYAARIIAPLGVPVLPVNLGSLGFHTQVRPDELLPALDSFADGNRPTQNRVMLQAELVGPEVEGLPMQTPVLALNDVVVSRTAWGRMVHLRIHVNGRPASDLFADGLIIATPTGSSAYNYAARGPVLEPSLEAFILAAICPHRMNFSPIVLPATSALRLEFHPRKPTEEAHLLIDGWHCCSVSHEHSLNISRAPMYLRLVVFEDDFFEKLREKLAWGGLN